MPEGTTVERVYQALLRQGKDKGTAARIAQAQTGLSLHTGKKPKRKTAQTFMEALKGNPDQPRVPAGSPEGGQWVAGGSNLSTPEEALNWHTATFNSSVGGNVEGARSALLDYSGLGGLTINEALRRGERASLTPAANDLIDRLDRVFDRVSLTEDVETLRYVPKRVVTQFEAAVGGNVLQKAYTSVMTEGGSPNVGDVDDPDYDDDLADYLGRNVPVLHVISKGAKALPMAHISRFFSEREVLVDRGSVWQVSKRGDQVVLTLVGTRRTTKTVSQPLGKANPDQPRVPAGSPDGGQWTDEGRGSGNDVLDWKLGTVKTGAYANDYWRDYPGTEVSFEINSALRAGKSLSAAQKKVALSLDAFIEAHTTVSDGLVFRGVDSVSSLFNKLSPGDVFVDKGFVSTTTDKDWAVYALSDVMKISVPKGAHVGPVELYPHPDISGEGLETNESENEVILPRGSRLRFDGRGPDYKGHRVFNFTLLTDVTKGSPDQPRVPAGNPEGGQWTDSGGGGAGPSKLELNGVREAISYKDHAERANIVDAVEWYVGYEGQKLNSELRRYERLPDAYKDRVAQLDRFASSHELTQDAVVWRGVGGRRADAVIGLAVGSAFTDNAYVSTTRVLDTASEFAGVLKSAIMEITLPKGTRVGVVKLLTGSDPEGEVVLPRGSKFKYVGIGKNIQGIKVFRFELVSGGTSKRLDKGNPEFNPDQPRNEDGTWTDGSGGGGGKPPDWRSKEGLQARFPGMDVAYRHYPQANEHAAVVFNRSGDPEFKFRFTWQENAQLAYLGELVADDSPAGRQRARDAMRLLLETAENGNAKSIYLFAGYDSGGYVWPRIGFENADRWNFIAEELVPRLAAINKAGGLPPELEGKVRALMAGKPRDIAAQIAQFDDPVDPTLFKSVIGAATRGNPKPTLGKLMLLNTNGDYTLPRTKFGNLRAWVEHGVVKGYPEYNNTQVRAADGTWTDGGGSSPSASRALDIRLVSDEKLVEALRARFPSRININAHKVPRHDGTGGAAVRVGMGASDLAVSFYVDSNTMKVSLVEVDDNPEGRKLAVQVLMTMRAIAMDSGVEQISILAGLSSGGYAWPRLGFDISPNDLFGVYTTVQERLKYLSDRKLITNADQHIVNAILYRWDKTGASRIAHLNTPTKLDDVQLYGVSGYSDIRGKQTLGKVLLSGLTADFVLPRAKFNVLARLGKSLIKGSTIEVEGAGPSPASGSGGGGMFKGSPDQPRVPAGSPEGGQWTDSGGGGGALSYSSAASIQAGIQARLPLTIVQVQEFGGGWDVLASDNVNTVKFFAPSGEGRPITFESINTADDEGGRKFARDALRVILDSALAVNASGIRLQAEGAGGYVWPKAGFELDPDMRGKDPVQYFLTNSGVGDRIKRARSTMGGTDARAFDALIKPGGLDLPARLAALDKPITMDQLVAISGANRYLRSAKVGKPTLGKALLIGTSGYYALPKDKFHMLDKYINRSTKALTFKQALAKYRPDQARDDHGRWVDEGGGGGDGDGVGRTLTRGNEALSLYEQNTKREGHLSDKEFIDSLPQAQRDFIDGAKAKIANSRTHSTDASPEEGGYRLRTPDGKPGEWLPSRQRLHESIIRDYITEAVEKGAFPEEGQQPMVVLMGGRGGAGKTSTVEKLLGVNPEKHPDFLYLNADDIKGKLPGYAGWNTGIFHEESSYISDQIERVARDLGLNIIYDATLKSEGSAVTRMKQYKDSGYRTEGIFVHTTPQTSARRAMARALSSGRYVPPAYILGSTTNEATFDRIKGGLDAWSLFDNNDKPKLVASKGSSKLK